MMTTEHKLMDTREAAAFLKMPKARVVRFANKGIIPHVRLPDKEPRFLVDDLLAWVKSQRQGPEVEVTQ